MLKTTQVRKRINITLPKDTVEMIDKIIEKGERSRLMDKAVRYFIDDFRNRKIKEGLKDAGLSRGKRDLILSREWYKLKD